MAEKKNDLMEWLGFANPPKFVNAPWVGKILGFLISALCLVVVGLMLVIIAKFTASAISGDFAENGDSARALRELGTVILALFGAPFLIWRTVIASKQAHTAEQGLYTDRIAKAVEQIGTDKAAKTQNGQHNLPNIEVRIGGLFSLRRLSRDSSRDRTHIMKILNAYITSNISSDAVLPHEDTDVAWDNWIKSDRFVPRTDALIAVDLLSELKSDLRKLPQGSSVNSDFSQATFTKVNLPEIELPGSTFDYAKMAGISLSFSKLQNSVFNWSDLRAAILFEVDFSGSIFNDVTFNTSTDVEGANFLGALFTDTDLSSVEISQEQLNQCMGISSVTIPPNLTRPSHWIAEELEWEALKKKWLAWQKSIGFDPENPEGSA